MIFISGNVPSSKNSKQWTGKCLINSKTVQKYLKLYAYQFQLPRNRNEFKHKLEGKEKPYKIGFYFVRDSKRRFDYINVCQLPCDLMTEYQWIDDDNANEIIPVFLGYEVDKNNPGVRIEVL
ncbi:MULTISPECIES: hypothetical protein [unclassified Fusobacterium]|uniref:hypothetical protein n=1 Tax=unclassified Fusobacterium TaxID=2648384 RepID=UPI001B8AEE41|nr:MULTISPECIES: hypothetical protein [unclassified Fusobacterium]MBR8701664.1 hypothetical protein [Fusobacterium sp. DD45]MBR8711445.1 hypothetical protein [Fusobacterium sp. DD28]MBR8751994.1 hypothetical protein [Fusobacterium sp. DD26]